MQKRFFDHDPLTGITEWFHYDSLTGDAHIESTQDVEPMLDANKALANDSGYSADGIKKEWWHYANIPVVVQLRWLNEYGSKNWPMRPENGKLLFKLLNSPEWRYLKATGKIHCGR